MLRDADDAQDIAQETFIRLWRSRLDLGDPRRVAAWIYRTATHLAVDRLRRNARGAEVRGVEADGSAPQPNLEVRQQLERLAAQLPADELELAFLVRVDGLTQPESAAVLGVSERTVRRMLSRLEERLKALE